MRTTERLNQAIVTSATNNGALRPKVRGDELKRRMPVIVQPPHQRLIALERHTRRIQPFAHRLEKCPRLARQISIDPRRIADQRLVAFGLGIQNPQRVDIQPLAAVLRQRIAVLAEMRDQRRPPRFPRRRVADGVQLQHDLVADPQFAQQLRRQRDHLDIRRRFRRAQHLGIQLVELPVPPLLRSLVTEQRPMRRELQRRMLLPAVRDIGTRNPGGEFGAQGQTLPAAILERIHFLRHHIGGLANGPGKHLGEFKHRRMDALEAIKFAHPVERLDHMVEPRRLLTKNVLRAPHAPRLVCHARALGDRAQPGNATNKANQQQAAQYPHRLGIEQDTNQYRPQRPDPRPNRIGRPHRNGPRRIFEQTHAERHTDQERQCPRQIPETVGIAQAGGEAHFKQPAEDQPHPSHLLSFRLPPTYISPTLAE